MQELRDNTRYVRISIGGGRYNIKLESITDSSKYIILSLPGSKFNGGSRDVGTCGYYLTSTLYDSN